MGLDMNVYATSGTNLTKDDLYSEEELWQDLDSWYWRKANSVHQWMVTNIQDDVDNCGVYEVDINQLRELKDVCEEVKTDISLAPTLLPTQAGFFFGNTDYDDWYKEDLDITIENINQMLDSAKTGPKRFFYTSSW